MDAKQYYCIYSNKHSERLFKKYFERGEIIRERRLF